MVDKEKKAEELSPEEIELKEEEVVAERVEEKALEKSSEEEMKNELLGGGKFDDIAFNVFQIDFTNRKIRMIPGVDISTSTRKFLKLRPEFLISGTIEADATVTTVANSTVETDLNSYTVPLNTISINDSNNDNAGNVFRTRASGVYSTVDATPTFSLRLKVGSTTYHTLTSTAAGATNQPWNVDWLIIISAIGSSGTAESSASAKINNVNKDAGSTSTQTINTTADQKISLTVEWSAANASNTLSIRQFLVSLLN